MSENLNGQAVKLEAERDTAPTVFYAEGIVIHRNRVFVPTTEGNVCLHACKVATVSPAYTGSIAGLVDLLNVGWAVISQHEARKNAALAAQADPTADAAEKMEG